MKKEQNQDGEYSPQEKDTILWEHHTSLVINRHLI